MGKKQKNVHGKRNKDSSAHPPAEYPPLSHRPAVFPVWCRETSSACWSRGSSSGPQRSRGPDPPQSPAGASRADSPSPWLPGRETVEVSAGRSHGANAANISAWSASPDSPGTLLSEGGTALASTKVLHVSLQREGYSVSSGSVRSAPTVSLLSAHLLRPVRRLAVELMRTHCWQPEAGL